MSTHELLEPLLRLPRRLTLQLSLLLTVLLVAGIGAHAWITAETQGARLHASIRAHAAALAATVAADAAPLLVLNDYAALEEQLLRAAALPDVLAIRVLDSTGQVVSNVLADADGAPRPDYTPLRLTPPTPDRLVQGERSDPELVAWTPVVSGEPVGWVSVTYSLDPARSLRARVLFEAAVTALLLAVANLALLRMYLKRRLRAIRLATEFASRLYARRGDELAVNAETDEIGQLQRSLNFASRQLRREHDAVTESTERLHALLAHTLDGILTISDAGLIESCNAAAERMFGTGAEALLGRSAEKVLPGWRATAPGSRLETEGRRDDGTVFPLELSLAEMWIGTQRLYAATVRDLSDSRRLDALNARLGRILEHAANEIYIFDADTLRFVQASDGALANLGYSSAELAERSPLDLMPGITSEEFAQLLKPLRDTSQAVVTLEGAHQRKDGTSYPVEMRLQLSRSERPPVFLAIVQDLTRHKRAEARLVYLANYDTLTDLPNRTLLAQRLEQTLVDADTNERLAAVLFIDLDRFKIINDTLGHAIGDELLRVVARRLTESVRPGDTVARYGGDEFVIVLANVAHVDDVTRVAEKVVGRLAPPMTIAGRELFVTPSIGITLYPLDERHGEELLRAADTAMYKAKERGGNTYEFFTPELNLRAQRRFTLEAHLRQSFDRGELRLYYQPQVDLASGRIVGAEALIRWQHPRWGLVPPAEFIPLAEETGLIKPVGQWVLAEACAEARAWHEAGHRGLRMAVNLSGRQLADRRFAAEIEQTIAAAGLARGALEVEVTESVLMQDLDQTAEALAALARLGVTVAMDDFGTGYSSLTYLKRLPIDALKIDQSFVRGLTVDPNDAAIVQAVIAMAHSLGIKVIAEGVETAEQLAFLERHGCDQAQGFYLGVPQPAEQFRAMLRERQRSRAGA